MDGTFIRGRIMEPAELRRLMGRSDLRGALQAGSHFGVLLLTGWLLWTLWGTWWAVPVFMIHGTVLNFLYAGQHELSHNTPFKTKWLNEWVGRLIGFLMIFPRDFDLIQHSAHHQYTQNWEKDGELAREPYTLTSYLLWFWGPTYWVTRIARVFRFARGVVIEPYIRPDQEALVIREARVHLALYGLLALGSVVFQTWAVVILWFAPLVAMKWVHQMQNTIEHLGLSHKDNILENTRSTRTNAVLRWLCWNMQYHTAHHAFPSVPFHNLRELNAKMTEGAGVPPHSMGYVEFQIELIRKLLGGKSEADYPYDEVWITPAGGRLTLD
ncbi:fatty acid desaturase [Rhodobacteraceae bacterium NNCM2]|nr:fatty acid desaturase [Coraliihabitans acroporae]